MNNISQILSVIDPTTDDQPALRRAAWVASNTGAEIEMLICYYNEYLSGDRLFDSRSLQETRREVLEGYEKFLETLAQPLRESGLTVKTRAIWDHPLSEGIVRHAAALNADLVFKDTHHHSAISRALLTNTDWSLIRACASPLWLVKSRELPEKPVILAAIDPMNEHDKPAALDDEILMLSKSLAQASNAEMHVFHSYDPRVAISTATANAYIPVSLPFDEIEKQMRQQHSKRFDEITTYHEVPPDHAHLVSGLAHEELPALAREMDALVVVMGAVARNPLKRLFIGSTAERTLGNLPCDMLIVKPAWFHTAADS
ncbi:MAG TPA: universal stress protein [Woeseiaceae bacterium]|nr:universal stress protein [Woeseiaceae bacterium]